VNLLAAKLYDPAVAVSKATSALLAMTAFDTVNLRLAIIVPAHGMVRFVLMVTLTGATTFPVVFLGVMNGATVLGRVTPTDFAGTASAATQAVPCRAEFVVTGLAPGAMNVDAAYGVEVLLAATNFKYGGPNNAVTNDAWGAFQFEAWDPQPQTANSILAVDVNGRVDVSKVLGTAQTAGDLKASMNTLQADTDDIQTRLPAALVGGRMDSSVGAMAAAVITAASIAAVALNGKGDWSTYAGGDTAGVTTLLGRLSAARALLLDNLDAAISSRSTYAGADTAGTTTLLARLSAARALLLDNLDAAISTVKSKTDNLPPDPADASDLLALLTVLQADTDNIQTRLPAALVGGRMDSSVGAMANAVITAAAIADAALNGKGDWSTYAGGDTAGVTTLLARLSAARALLLDNLDGSISSVKAKTNNLPAAPAAVGDVPTSLAIAAQVLASAALAPIAADIKKVNAVTVVGDGSGTPWGP
jgi:hypothetical protein